MIITASRVELMSRNCDTSSMPHPCTTTMSDADAAGRGDDGDEWRRSVNHYETVAGCRSSSTNFYKPMSTSTSHEVVGDPDQFYEDIDIYLTPITDRL